MPTLTFVARDVLHRGATRFAGELGKAGLMHTIPTRLAVIWCVIIFFAYAAGAAEPVGEPTTAQWTDADVANSFRCGAIWMAIETLSQNAQGKFGDLDSFGGCTKFLDLVKKEVGQE